MDTTTQTETMDDLFARAEREGLWFYSHYQDFWLSPGELREEQANGQFRWGPVNWELRNPFDGLQSLHRKSGEALAAEAAFKARLDGALAAAIEKHD